MQLHLFSIFFAYTVMEEEKKRAKADGNKKMDAGIGNRLYSTAAWNLISGMERSAKRGIHSGNGKEDRDGTERRKGKAEDRPDI